MRARGILRKIKKIMQIHAQFHFFNVEEISESKIKTKLAGGKVGASGSADNLSPSSAAISASPSSPAAAPASNSPAAAAPEKFQFGGKAFKVKFPDEAEVKSIFDKMSNPLRDKTSWQVFIFIFYFVVVVDEDEGRR